MHDENTPKLCECGCGQVVPLAKRTKSAKGHIKGEPMRFVHGHNNRVASDETRKKIGAASAARPRTAETYEKVAAALRGRPRSDEVRARISEGRRNGKTPVRTPEGIAFFRAKMIGENHPNWDGGRALNAQGYVVLTRAGHPMADPRGRVMEHRVVMAEHLGRMLDPQEVVHHVNGDRADNRIENLQLLASQSEHSKLHGKQGDFKRRRTQ